MVAAAVKVQGVAVEADEPTKTADRPIGNAGPPPPSMPRLAAPLQVRDPDRYEVLSEHGRGGLGTVSRAHDKELGRHVAIKELLSRGDVGEVRFLREALITARLEHPGIVPIHEAGRWPDGTPFYVMKLVAGRSLKELLATRSTVDERLQLLHHVIAVADAVAYAHKRRIIHRDLKPANVIAGDFGETVVIDWGLAKDLTAAEEPGGERSPYRAAPLDDLTAAGSVLGTPLYMAPEQWRGEPADQRADVFAIGAMLWELCSMQRVPPAETRHRRRLLRRAGIDKDLIAIICKALAADPDDRYLDAGQLADDLNAFKSGARIAARRYSLLDILVHWTRRHRALATTVASAMVLGILGTILFVTNVAVERDRADSALAVSRTEQHRAEQANAELVLKNGELLLQHDPTAAAAAVAGYRGNDDGRRQRLIAEAEGRGVARAVLTPHSDTIWFLTGDASGSVFSLGEDRKVGVTKGNVSSTIAADVSTSVSYDYAPASERLAYATTPAGIAVLDLRTHAKTRIESPAPTAIAIARDASRLAALDARGVLRVWSLSPVKLIYEQALPQALHLMFAGGSRIVVREKAAIRVISIDRDAFATVVAPLATSTFEARDEDIVTGDTSGRLTLLSAELKQISTVRVCHDRINNVRLATRARVIAFACNDGIAGVARYDDVHDIVVESFSTKDASFDAEPDPNGERVAVLTESTDVYFYDVATRLVTRYEGQGAQVSFIAAPSPGFDHVLIGDVDGGVRVYDPPSRDARVVLHAPSAVYGADFSPDGQTIVTDGSDHVVRQIRLADRSVTELPGHEDIVLRVRFAPDGASFLSFSNDGTVRAWSPADQHSVRTFKQHAGVIGDAEYTDGGRHIASVGDDGRLLLWSPQGDDVSVLFTHSAPLNALEVLAHDGHIVVHDPAGAVWDVNPRGLAKEVRAADGTDIRLLRASQDGRLLAIGTASGAVTVYETGRYTVLRETTLPDSIRQIYFDPSDRDLLISSEAGHVRLLALDARRSIPWHDVAIEARDVAYSPDGETLAFVCRDGGSWFYTVRDNAWVYARDHTTSVLSGRFSRDGTSFVSTDRNGFVVVRNVSKTITRKERGRR